MKKLIIIILIGITFAGCEDIKSIRELEKPSPEAVQTNLVVIDDNGFNPSEIILTVGEELRFTNITKIPITIYSDPHPDHNQLRLFNLGPIFKDQSTSYKFDNAGVFGIHSEENPSIKAKIFVQSNAPLQK